MNLMTNQMERINCVRMYLGVMYISEICNEEGTAIREGYEDGTNRQETYNITLTIPKQKKPNTSSWKLWWKVLQSFTTGGSKRLTKGLGEWTENHSKPGQWIAYKHDNKAYKYRKTEEENHEYWEVYTQHGMQLIQEDNINIDEFDPKLQNSTTNNYTEED
jgi:hypothetical protein